ncbi:hypothetical protein AMTR_s00099p00056160 [Amborella trichopoda]|uniref:Uncharacterized protein n=1 Tax=Amborella trichopoda TaxID=13333 RepID=W1NWK2_AMBTC|nr:hypothetical protein AMTR_s00099p00056160 [Amborella trichopoda]
MAEREKDKDKDLREGSLRIERVNQEVLQMKDSIAFEDLREMGIEPDTCKEKETPQELSRIKHVSQEVVQIVSLWLPVESIGDQGPALDKTKRNYFPGKTCVHEKCYHVFGKDMNCIRAFDTETEEWEEGIPFLSGSRTSEACIMGLDSLIGMGMCALCLLPVTINCHDFRIWVLRQRGRGGEAKVIKVENTVEDLQPGLQVPMIRSESLLVALRRDLFIYNVRSVFENEVAVAIWLYRPSLAF